MDKRVIVSIIVIAVVVLVIPLGLIIFDLIPDPVDVTLEMVKLDEDGNEAGDFTIRIRGSLANYPFQDDHMELTIPEFDEWGSMHFSDRVFMNTHEAYKNHFYQVAGWTTSDQNDFIFVDIGYDQDMDRWVLEVHADTGTVYYVGSVSGSYSAEELAEYFAGLTPLRWFYDSE